MEEIKEMEYLSFNMKTNATGNISIETYDDFGKIYKETGVGYNRKNFVIAQLVKDRLDISSEFKERIGGNGDLNWLVANLGGFFKEEEIGKDHYHCVLQLPKENFYSNKFLCEKRLLEKTKSIKILTKLVHSKFDEIKLKVIIHPNTSFNILNNLSKDENSYISEKAKIGLNKK